MTRQPGQRVLLIQPLGYASSAAGGDISRLANIMPPLGLASLAAWLEQHGVETDLVDCFAQPDSDARIRELIQQRRPRLIGISSTTSSFPDAIRIATMVKRLDPRLVTVLGGAHGSALGCKILETQPSLDCIVVGEGEGPLLALVERDPRDLPEVAGLCLRPAPGETLFTGLQNSTVELDQLPFPAYHKLAGYPASYSLPIFNYPRTPNTSCISSRGCPYHCSYCDRSVFRRSFRYNSAAYLYEHLSYLHNRWGIRHINFYDDQFTFNRQRVVEFCHLMIERPLGMTFNCAVRAEHVDPALLDLMKAAGCWMISLGIETGDPELLAQHRQHPDLDRLAETIHQIKRARIRVKGLMMMGLPGETGQTIRNSMNYILKLPIDDLNIAKFTPFPGSPLYQQAHQLGQFDETPENQDCMNFVFVPNGLSRDFLERMFSEFYRRHFCRPRIIWGYTKMLWQSPDSWRRFTKNLGAFVKFAGSNRRHREEPAKTTTSTETP